MMQTEMLDALRKMNELLEKINQNLELALNPVFVYDAKTGELKPLNWGGKLFKVVYEEIKEKRDDSNL